MSDVHIADALEQGIFDIKDGCAKIMNAPHSVMEQAAGLIRLHERLAEQLEAERDTALVKAAKLREALEPFAQYSIPKGDGTRVIEVLCDDLRRVRAVLAETKGE
jgi:hypothetical protein